MEDKDIATIATGVAIAVIIFIIYYYWSGWGASPPPPPHVQAFAKVGNSFNLKGSADDINAAGQMQREFGAFSTKAKAGDVRGAIESLNNALEAMQMIEPDSLSSSITHAHSQACMPPEIRRDLNGITSELHRTSLLTAGLATWAQNVAVGLPDCPSPSGMRT